MKKLVFLIGVLIIGSMSIYGQNKFFIYENSSLNESATKDKKGYVSGSSDVPKYIVTKESWKFNSEDRFFVYENSSLNEPATKDKKGYVSESSDVPKYIVTKESWKF